MHMWALERRHLFGQIIDHTRSLQKAHLAGQYGQVAGMQICLQQLLLDIAALQHFANVHFPLRVQWFVQLEPVQKSQAS